ncbi:MAG: hypothetical protein ACI8UO_000204 [Verrucomicrobiales bacterium]|jgi:hypothetical protein
MSAARFSLLSVLALLIPSLASAGGSCTWEDAERILAQAPKIRDHLKATLEIEEIGSATRLGRHFENLGGARIGPYVFEAKPKDASGGAQFNLVIETAYTFLDGAGSEIADDGEPEKADDVKEKFLSARLEAISSAAGGGVGRIELSEADAKTRSRWIGDHWGEIEEREQRVVKIEVEADDDPVSGVVERLHHPQTGLIEAIKIDMALSDHGGVSEQFFFWDEELFFVLRQDSHWKFDPKKEGRTIDLVAEERFYFAQGGGVYRALSKKYEANSEEDLDAARDAAKNTPLDFEDDRPAELIARAAKLLDAVTEADILAIYLAE